MYAIAVSRRNGGVIYPNSDIPTWVRNILRWRSRRSRECEKLRGYTLQRCRLWSIGTLQRLSSFGCVKVWCLDRIGGIFLHPLFHIRKSIICQLSEAKGLARHLIRWGLRHLNGLQPIYWPGSQSKNRLIGRRFIGRYSARKILVSPAAWLPRASSFVRRLVRTILSAPIPVNTILPRNINAKRCRRRCCLLP